MELDKVKQNLEAKGYIVSIFENKNEVCDYLKKNIINKTIGFGGSQTLTDLDLRNVLSENNTLFVPDFVSKGETFKDAAEKGMKADVYLLSINGLSENGEIVNIDGRCNRISASLYGHEKIYYVVGQNKIVKSLDDAIYRARNIAAPKNALRLNRNVPCALAVKKELEEKFKAKYKVEEIDNLKWAEYLESLSLEELNTHCYDCSSPDRICRGLLINLVKPRSMDMEVIIVKEDLGY